jgi:nitrite reductase (NO-forming)
LVLPRDIRLGLWLPLHLALVGAASVAISGAMQSFALTMTASADPPDPLVWLQFALVNAGALMIVVGHPFGDGWLVAIGGVAFLAGALILGWIVLRSWRRALNRRHALIIRMYMIAVGCVVVGGGLGAIVGSGRVRDPSVYVALRYAHETLNVLGWVSLTIAATLVTLLPTTLRIRMPPWHGASTASLLVAGVVALAAGLALRSAALAGAGALAYAAGAIGVTWMVLRGVRTPRRWRPPLAAKHLLCAVAWFLYGSIAMATVILRDGLAGFDGFRGSFLLIFVAGWIVQTLLGAWLYLLPMAKPAHPDERRRFLIGIELGAGGQVLALNVGIALILVARTGWLPSGTGTIGVVLAIAGVTMALLKAWLFVPLGRMGPAGSRAKERWGP